ncbi:hypothetical protein CRUP_003905 [Coryphaenoides rupestris]|nr:hypothetical protein CRUP_003905 [Coryphaenoides rupestris]
MENQSAAAKLTAEESAIHQTHRQACEAKQQMYVDPSTGYKVFTEHGHLRRGKCCGSACRHQSLVGGYKEIRDPDRTGKDRFGGNVSSGRMRARTRVLIFKQHLSSPYINVWSFYTDNVIWPGGSSLHTGQLDNQIPEDSAAAAAAASHAALGAVQRAEHRIAGQVQGHSDPGCDAMLCPLNRTECSVAGCCCCCC